MPGTRGTVLLTRYAPFLALVAVQLVLVGVAPSVGRSSATSGAPAPLALGQDGSVVGAPGGAPGAGTPVTGGGSGPAAAGPAGTAPSTAAGGAAGAPAGTAGGGQVAGSTAPGAVPRGAAAATGTDRSRCAKGGRLQQAVTQQSVPCAPRFTGDNGGATYRGVTREKLTIVLYQPKVNPVVNSVIQAAGAGEDPAAQRDALAAFASFFQKHYELAGRTVEWKTFSGDCTVDPPDNPCLQAEARTIVSTMKPFWVLWPTGRPAFFRELSRLGVLNSGGLTYGGSFSRGQRPYHWSAFMDGDRVATNVADYWCKKMNGKNAALAGDQALRTQKRKLGILVRQDPANKEGADLLSSLVSGGRCAGPKPTIITYSQDISQSQQQNASAVAALRQAGVTTVVSLGSVLEISLQAQGFTRNGYFPENLMSGAGLTDIDQAARIIPADQWDNAFGPGNLVNAQPREKMDDSLAWRDAGRSGTPYTQAGILFQEMQQIVWQLQLTGPRLTPLDVERASLSMPVLGGWDNSGRNPFVQRYQFSDRGYSGPSDSREVYWSSTARSAADGQAGAYIALRGGQRYPVGSFPGGNPKT